MFIKNFIRAHKVAITAIVTAIPLVALQLRNQNILNNFLKDHDLLDEYYDGE